MTKTLERMLDRVALHLGDGERRVVDPGDVYFLEAQDEDTRVRFRSAKPLVDMRPLRELVPLFVPHGFLQIHREYVVNLRRVYLIRRRDEGRDWEIKLEPPVNRVPPVSRSAIAKLWRAFGGE
jgi:DNA-binding LytR/AlgR family response regulator